MEVVLFFSIVCLISQCVCLCHVTFRASAWKWVSCVKFWVLWRHLSLWPSQLDFLPAKKDKVIEVNSSSVASILEVRPGLICALGNSRSNKNKIWDFPAVAFFRRISGTFSSPKLPSIAWEEICKQRSINSNTILGKFWPFFSKYYCFKQNGQTGTICLNYVIKRKS